MKVKILQESIKYKDYGTIIPTKKPYPESNHKYSKFFHAEKGEVCIYHENQSIEVLLGIGEELSPEIVRNTGLEFSFNFKKKWERISLIDFTRQNWKLEEEKSIILGLFLGAYSIKKYNDSNDEIHPFLKNNYKLFVLSQHLKDEELEKLWTTATVIHSIQDLVNGPANIITPIALGKYVENISKLRNLDFKILSKKEIIQKGLNALLAVNKGSDREPILIEVVYRGKTEKKGKKIALIGKGVTFDTGGISLKPGANMHYMKSDMGGASIVLGAIQLASIWNLPHTIIGVIPCTDNMIDNTSIVPGDVIETYSGKTIEVINTDAEGRLILADGISYAVRNLNPDVLIDIATLTGSAVRSLGTFCSAFFTNNSKLEESFKYGMRLSGEKIWKLPLWKEYGDMIKSDVADIMNLSKEPLAGAITAAKFLEFFIEEHPCWAHLDVAGTVFGNTIFGKDKNATGYGPLLLLQTLNNII